MFVEWIFTLCDFEKPKYASTLASASSIISGTFLIGLHEHLL
ncbi:hypothetical protein ACZ87_02096 [Candidatus Erwinia dacicola]|uniref:Uncharacterized protein n=1 Tax=Candidatus Erwinia dacicola TaxID=252393 RepID=A0A328TTE8_9GAMM|nr:hypothetical protein ACZ87_02096 [Candidatus Erwinia dacicola]